MRLKISDRFKLPKDRKDYGKPITFEVIRQNTDTSVCVDVRELEAANRTQEFFSETNLDAYDLLGRLEMVKQ